MKTDDLESRVAALEKLVHALTLSAGGWRTDDEGARFREAWYIVGNDARRQHLEAELALLRASNGGAK